MAIKLRICNEDDRLRVAAVLIKNGYSVEQGRDQRIGLNGQPTKHMGYALIINDRRGEAAE
jgi:hypothetical protein